MDIFINAIEKMKEEGHNIEVEVGWKDKDRKKTIIESIKKIKDSGDEIKLKYVNDLYRYYSIFLNLGHLVRSNPLLVEKKVKYHCEDFYHYLDDKVVDSSKRIITGIISAVANDEPLDSFHKYLMFPKLYEKEYSKKNEDEDEDEDED